MAIASTWGPLEWQAAADRDWIALGGREGKLSGEHPPIQLLVLVDTEGLQAGTYQGTITIEAPGAQGSPAKVAVTLALKLELTITKLDFPEQVPSDGSKALGTVEFTDDGDINKVAFAVVKAVSFTAFAFNPKEAPS